MANDPGSTLDDTGELQPSPPCTPCDGLFILGEARAYTLNKGEYTLFSIGEQLAATNPFKV